MTFTDTAAIEAAWRAAFEPQTPPPVLEWAEQFRLNAGDSALPGPINLRRWQTDVLAAYDRPAISRVVVMASSQVGKTVLGLLIAAHAVRFKPNACLYVVENEIAADNFAKARVKPALDANAADILLGRREGAGQKLGEYSFSTGSSLIVVGANAPHGLSSRPASTCVATEVRGFPLSAGKNGDPLSLMLARGKSFPRFKAFIESSPGILHRCRLTEEYALGDCRRWHLRCPHCDHAAPVSFNPVAGEHHVAFDKRRVADAGIVCTSCGVIWSPQDRLSAIRNGHFAPTKEPDDPTVVSFRYSELESEASTIPSIVQRFLNAQGKPDKLLAFDNTVLGIVHDPDSAATILDETHIASVHTEHFDGEVLLPDDALILTAGVDVQPNRLEVQVVGHGEANRHFAIALKTFPGDTLGPTVWQTLQEYLEGALFRHPLGGHFPITSAFIDSSDGNSTSVVYEFSAKQQIRGRKWFAIKGREGERPIVTKSKNTVLRKTDPYRLLLVGVDTQKLELFSALQNEPTAYENRIIFPKKFGEAYFAGLTSEKCIISTDKDGGIKRRFVKVERKVRNESLDTLVYALACFHNIQPAPDFASIRARLSTTQPQRSIADVASRLRSMPGFA